MASLVRAAARSSLKMPAQFAPPTEDVISGDDGDNILNGTDGADTITGGAGNDTIDGRGGTDDLDGGDGADIVSYVSSTRGVIIDLTAGQSYDGLVNERMVNFENAFGSPFNDTVFGTAGANRIEGRAGNDTISAGPGADVLLGGSGNDTLNGGPDDDLLDGGTGDDALDGGDGVDTITYVNADPEVGVFINLEAGNTQRDQFDRLSGIENAIGSNGGDVITGDNGNNVLTGLAGDDRMRGGGGADTLLGGDGNDVIFSGAGVDAIDGGAGFDTFDLSEEDIGTIVDLEAGLTYNGSFNETIAGIERVQGSGRADAVYGNGAANSFAPGAGEDTFFGGGGVDTVVYDDLGPGRSIIVDLASGLSWDGRSNDRLSGVENVVTTVFSDSIYGDGGDNRINPGASGADVIYGNGGVDTLDYGGAVRGITIDLGVGRAFDGQELDEIYGIEIILGSAFRDTAFGSEAGETVRGGDGNDTLSGFGGNDTLSGDEGDDTISGGGGSDTLSGGAGTDTLSFADGGPGGYVINLTLASATGVDGTDTLSGFENVIGSPGNDTITLAFGGFADGNGGRDTLRGAPDFTSVLRYANNARAVTIDLLNGNADDGLDVDTVSNFRSVIGSAFNDTLLGSNSADTFNLANGGQDSVNGRSGSDTVTYSGLDRALQIDLGGQFANDGVDTDALASVENVRGGERADAIAGTSGTNRLEGGGGGDALLGREGTDTLLGGAGDDYLYGGTGADTLTGGSDNDTFVLRRSEVASDIITDFEGNGSAVGDVLRLDGWGTGSAVTLVSAASGTYRVTDGVDGFSETFRVQGTINLSTDVIFG